MTEGPARGHEDFARAAGPYRRELLAHCYRMLGSADEAEDLVQETYLRAWRAYGGFEGHSSLRVWLYRIATNACLNALRGRARRVLPCGLGAPAASPEATSGTSGDDGDDVWWLEPMPDALVTPPEEDPAAIAASREQLRLALIAGLQYLPPRQRAVLLLREVLGFPAAEVADMLGSTVPAMKSALQRARAALEEAAPDRDRLTEPTDPRTRELLAQYIAGFENADVAALERALRSDAAIEMAGTRAWFSGKAACLRFLAGTIGSPGDWLMTPTAANGQLAAGAYRRDPDGVHCAFGLGVLTTTPEGIARITVFGGGAALLARFGLPAVRGPHAEDRPKNG